jgi:hypothetical protein
MPDLELHNDIRPDFPQQEQRFGIDGPPWTTALRIAKDVYKEALIFKSTEESLHCRRSA